MSDLVILEGLPIQTAAAAKITSDASNLYVRRARRFLRSSSLRFAFLYIVLFAASAFILSFLLWYSTIDLMNRESQSSIRSQAQSLAEHFHQGGLAALSSTISKQIFEGMDDHALYLLVDDNDKRISGNLDHWPTLITVPHQWYRLPLIRYEIKMQAIYRFYPLPNGYRLLLGRDTRTSAHLGGVLYESLLIGTGAMILLGLIGGVVVKSQFKRAMKNLHDITGKISRGDLSGRVKLRGAEDEFDELAHTINKILDEVQKLMDNVRQVTDAVAHDLRTPITRARSRLEATLVAETRPAEMREAMEASIEDLDKIGKIFQSLLRIAEVEAGSRRSEFKDIDIFRILEDIHETYSLVAEEKDVELIGRWEEGPHLFGDQQMIHQAVANLVDNAIKFTPERSTVNMLLSLEKNRILISVADEGEGIPESDRKKVTQRFYRGEAARNTPGNGLGLSMVSAIAELHYGHLRLDDNAPGLKATLDLPYAVNKSQLSGLSERNGYNQGYEALSFRTLNHSKRS
jgi:signal transduction histidine kinase